MATLKLRGKSWQLSWSEDGIEQRISLGQIPLKQAKTILQAKQIELSTGARLLALSSPSAAPTFSEWVDEYAAWHELEYPDSHYRVAQILEQHLVPEFGPYFIDAITPEQVEKYKATRKRKGAKSATIVKELRTLKALINRAVDLELIAKNPVKIVKAPKILDSKPHRFYTKAELDQLYAATQVGKINGGATNPEHAAWWKFMANSGLRRMEALHLKRKDVGSDGIHVLSTEEERTKSGHWRDVPLTTGAREALERIPKRDDGFVLPRIQPASLSRAAIEDAERAGIGGSLHTLRHTYISHLVLAGVPLRTVQIYAGHSSMAVTEKYAYLRPDRVIGPAVEMDL